MHHSEIGDGTRVLGCVQQLPRQPQGLTMAVIEWRSMRAHGLSAPPERGKFRARIRKAALLDQIPSETWQQDWNVNCQAVPNAEASIQYLAPYVFKVAISDGCGSFRTTLWRVTPPLRRSGLSSVSGGYVPALGPYETSSRPPYHRWNAATGASAPPRRCAGPSVPR